MASNCADHPVVGEAKGVGLIGAVELVADKATRASHPPAKMVGQACANYAQAEGLFVRALLGDRVAFCPPLIITEAEINEMFDRFVRALDKTQAWLRTQ